MEINVEQAVRLAADACVIAGIIFLALQLRQSNRLLEAQARYSLRQYRSDVTDTFLSPQVLEAVHKYAAGRDVTPAERSAALMAALKGIELWEWQHGEYRAGILPREHLPIEAWRSWFNGKGLSPVPFREVWELRKGMMNPEFARFFETEVLQAGR